MVSCKGVSWILLIFLLYINLISDLNLDRLFVCYADDACLLFFDKSWEGVHHKITVSVKKIYQCLRDKNLMPNDKKSRFMTFSINKICLNFNPIIIYLNKCSRIKEVTRIRYLGIIFINNLRWNLHSLNLVGKLYAIMYTF